MFAIFLEALMSLCHNVRHLEQLSTPCIYEPSILILLRVLVKHLEHTFEALCSHIDTTTSLPSFSAFFSKLRQRLDNPPSNVASPNTMIGILSQWVNCFLLYFVFSHVLLYQENKKCVS